MAIIFEGSDCFLIDMKEDLYKSFTLKGYRFEPSYDYRDVENPYSCGKSTLEASPIKSRIMSILSVIKNACKYFEQVQGNNVIKYESLNCSYRGLRNLQNEPGNVQFVVGKSVFQSMQPFSCYTNDEIVDKLFVNAKENAVPISIHGKFIIIPKYSSFVLTDIRKLDEFDIGYNYDTIIIDPPWDNKSVKRSGSYPVDAFTLEDIEKINIRKLLREAGVIYIWVTNNERLQNYLLNVVLLSWNVIPLGRLLYLKVTRNGEPVYDPDSKHRKPYESCIVAMRMERNEHAKTYNSINELPIIKFVVAVPLTLHSKKPCLKYIHERLFPSRTRNVLELFARYPVKGWTTVGNEFIEEHRLK